MNGNSLFHRDKQHQGIFLKSSIKQVAIRREEQVINQQVRSNKFHQQLFKIQYNMTGQFTKLIVIYVGILIFGLSYLISQYKGETAKDDQKEYTYGWIFIGIFTTLFWLYFTWLIKKIPVKYYLKNLDFYYYQFKTKDFSVLKGLQSPTEISKYCLVLLTKELSFKQLNLIEIKAQFLNSYDELQNKIKDELFIVISAKNRTKQLEFDGRLLRLKEKLEGILHFSEQITKLLIILFGIISAIFSFFKEGHTSQEKPIPLSDRDKITGSILGGTSLLVIILYWLFRIRKVRVETDKIVV